MVQVLDGILKITEEKVGIIYSVGEYTEAVLNKIGNYSIVEKIWKRDRNKFAAMEYVLSDYKEKFYLLELPTDTPGLSEIHNVSRLEMFLIKNKIHPLGRREK